MPQRPVPLREPPLYSREMALRRLQGLHRRHRREQLHGHHVPRQQIQLPQGRPEGDTEVHRQEQALRRRF